MLFFAGAEAIIAADSDPGITQGAREGYCQMTKGLQDQPVAPNKVEINQWASTFATEHKISTGEAKVALRQAAVDSEASKFRCPGE